ncbi:dihydrofolate reductase [Ruania alba]|nr:dihydrofolate reductase [Ruania alba]
MIWAQAHHRVIGRAGDLPWHLPEDMRHFRESTAGHPVLMGRKQWESLPERFRPLPGRRNIVLTRDPSYPAPGAEVVTSMEQALALVEGEEAWICGGGEIYTAAMAHADRLLVTEIDLDVEGDTYAPVIGPEWHAAPRPWQTARTGTQFRILDYRRRA